VVAVNGAAGEQPGQPFLELAARGRGSHWARTASPGVIAQHHGLEMFVLMMWPLLCCCTR
jgi:hypothetical protein